MKILPNSSFIRAVTTGMAILSFAGLAKATPFASCVTNTSGTISFFLNEPGGNVTITYEDGTTNTGFNGVTTGTNLPSGVQSFSLVGHTTYAIAVAKNGTGAPSLITSTAVGTPRGVDANKIPTSPYFGHVYEVNGGVGVYLLNSDLSVIQANALGGVTWNDAGNGTGHSPDWAAVAPDGSVLITGTSENGTAIYQFPGNFSTNQLFLGPVGAIPASSDVAHGIILARAILTGSVATSNAVLYTVDGDLGNPGSIQVYDIGAGPLPWTNAPTYQGAQVSIAGFTAEALGGNPFPGFTMGPNGYIYASTFRSAPGSANFVIVTDSTGSNLLWTSAGTGTPPTGDWFYQPDPAIVNGVGPITPGTGLEGTSAVSPDGNYLVAESIDNYFIIAPLTNGIPNTSAIFVAGPSSYTGNGRGVAWDAADNIILSSSGIGTVQTWTLGTSATAITTGNASGTTGFQLIQPSTTVSVVATQPNATQGGVNGAAGTPVAGQFTITRTSTNGFANAQTVNYTLSGTATAGGAYTVLSTNSVVIPAGQSNVIVTINPTTNNVPRATTTVILSLKGGAGYSVLAPFSDTVTIQNTSSQQIQLAALASSMYRAFSNDFASFTLTRLGDTNAPSYTVSTFTFGGTAIAGTDFTLPTNVTFNPGDISYTNIIMPLVGGQLPVDTNVSPYIGNLTAIIGLAAGSGYGAATNTASLTSIDSATQPTTVLWSTPLTDPAESNNWHTTYGSADMVNVDTNDYEVTFGYDLTANASSIDGGIGLPPNGATTCLRVTANKEALAVGASAGVNAYPIGITFSNNYAVRFNMNLVQGSTAGRSTEGAIFGIDHGSRGYATNWWVGDGIVSTLPGLPNWTADGIWYWIDGDAGGAGAGDYIEFTSISNTFPNTGWQMVSTKTYPTFINNFKSPVPFSAANSPGGIPANETGFNTGVPAAPWSDVEVKQINGVVTLSIDKVAIFTYTNTTIWTNGSPMLGFNDPFVSIQNEDGAVYYSNLRVVQIGAPKITSIALAPVGTPPTSTNVVIRFSTTDGDDSITSFNLLSSAAVNGIASTLDTATTATFTQLGSGAFQATTTLTTNAYRFYRIQHK